MLWNRVSRIEHAKCGCELPLLTSSELRLRFMSGSLTLEEIGVFMYPLCFAFYYNRILLVEFLGIYIPLTSFLEI